MMRNNTDYPSELHAVLGTLGTLPPEGQEGKLFDYQRNVFNFMTKMNQRGILLYHSVGSGKCMAADTMIMMADGSYKKIQKINVGDSIMGDDSSPRLVTSLAKGTDQMYNVWHGATKYTVNSEHVLCLKSQTYPYCWSYGESKVVQYLDEGNVKTKIFKADEDVAEFMATNNSNIIHVTVKDYLSSPDLVDNARGFKVKVDFPANPVNMSPSVLASINAKAGKPMPSEYIINSTNVREQVAASIIGVKGRLYQRHNAESPYDSYLVAFDQSNKKLMDQFVFILNTLGILFSLKKTNLTYRVVVYGRGVEAIHAKSIWSDFLLVPEDISIDSGYKISVKPAGVGAYYGFTITGNRRYLLADCTVTHNTMTSVSIAEFFKASGRDILVLSSKALQINYKKEIQKFTDSEDLDNYSFITSNARNMVSKITNETAKSGLDEMLNHVNKKSLDNKVVIVDEAHNLFNSIVNGSEIANTFYDMVMDAKNLKIIFMTGTPIINDPFELAICYNMIVGNMGKPGRKRARLTILPEYYTDFVKYFIDRNNDDKFKNRIYGLTSYYGDFYTTEIDMAKQLRTTVSKENYPDRLPIKFEMIPMSDIQSVHYLKARETERLENSSKYGRGISKDASKGSTSYRIKSRQVSNVYISDNGKQDSPKIDKMVSNILATLDEPGTVLVYSTFLKYGILAIANKLNQEGFSQFSGSGPDGKQGESTDVPDGKQGESTDRPRGRQYAVFSGEQSIEERELILKTFNADSNKNGEEIKIIMITKSGTEGLDLKNVRHLHITEPYWNYSLIQQVIARGVRYKSHQALPEQYRNVQVYMYLSDYNKTALMDLKEKSDKVERTTDIHMITNAIKSQAEIYKFLKLIASTSIECKFFNTKAVNYDCYSCKATNEPLFVEDIHKDMQTSNKCVKTKQVVAHEILLDGNPYYYTDSMDVYVKSDSVYVKVSDVDLVDKVKQLAALV